MVHVAIVKSLAKGDANVSQTYKHDYSQVNLAALKGEVVELLRKVKVDIDLINLEGNTQLSSARKNDHGIVVDFFLKAKSTCECIFP